MNFTSNFHYTQMTNHWRESLQEKYGNPERNDCYEYQEWRDGMKDLLLSFQREIEEKRIKNYIECEKDYQTLLGFSKNKKKEIERKNQNPEKENLKKRKFET